MNFSTKTVSYECIEPFIHTSIKQSVTETIHTIHEEIVVTAVKG